jgi:hypothetical protein
MFTDNPRRTATAWGRAVNDARRKTATPGRATNRALIGGDGGSATKVGKLRRIVVPVDPGHRQAREEPQGRGDIRDKPARRPVGGGFKSVVWAWHKVFRSGFAARRLTVYRSAPARRQGGFVCSIRRPLHDLFRIRIAL